MASEDKAEAKKHAARAAKQLGHAAKNAVEAADLEKEHVVGEVVSTVRQAAVPQAVLVGMGVGAGLALIAQAGYMRYNKYLSEKKRAAEMAAKRDHHIQPSGEV